jgi:hypothetical protein
MTYVNVVASFLALVGVGLSWIGILMLKTDKRIHRCATDSKVGGNLNSAWECIRWLTGRTQRENLEYTDKFLHLQKQIDILNDDVVSIGQSRLEGAHSSTDLLVKIANLKTELKGLWHYVKEFPRTAATDTETKKEVAEIAGQVKWVLENAFFTSPPAQILKDRNSRPTLIEEAFDARLCDLGKSMVSAKIALDRQADELVHLMECQNTQEKIIADLNNRLNEHNYCDIEMIKQMKFLNERYEAIMKAI